MTYERDHYTLSTGRRFYANGGILGLSPESGVLCEGYDGNIETLGTFLDVAETDDDRRDLSAWTADERAEVADEMIRRWTAFKRI
jgi:hypothetical protein